MTQQPQKHGGKRVAGPGKRIGRPRKDNPRTAVFSVAIAEDELQLLRDTDAREWARDVLLKAAKRRVK